jgi:hypothetical protein
LEELEAGLAVLHAVLVVLDEGACGVGVVRARARGVVDPVAPGCVARGGAIAGGVATGDG